jgi:hypothetical protein
VAADTLSLSQVRLPTVRRNYLGIGLPGVWHEILVGNASVVACRVVGHACTTVSVIPNRLRSDADETLPMRGMWSGPHV